MEQSIKKIPFINEEIASKLKCFKIINTNDLLNNAATQFNRDHLAQITSIDKNTLNQVIAAADLYRIKGIGKKTAKLLIENFNINSIDDLKTLINDVEKIKSNINLFNKQFLINITKIKEQVNKLPKIIHYHSIDYIKSVEIMNKNNYDNFILMRDKNKSSSRFLSLFMLFFGLILQGILVVIYVKESYEMDHIISESFNVQSYLFSIPIIGVVVFFTIFLILVTLFLKIAMYYPSLFKDYLTLRLSNSLFYNRNLAYDYNKIQVTSYIKSLAKTMKRINWIFYPMFGFCLVFIFYRTDFNDEISYYTNFIFSSFIVYIIILTIIHVRSFKKDGDISDSVYKRYFLKDLISFFLYTLFTCLVIIIFILLVKVGTDILQDKFIGLINKAYNSYARNFLNKMNIDDDARKFFIEYLGNYYSHKTEILNIKSIFFDIKTNKDFLIFCKNLLFAFFGAIILINCINILILQGKRAFVILFFSATFTFVIEAFISRFNFSNITSWYSNMMLLFPFSIFLTLIIDSLKELLWPKLICEKKIE